MEKLLLPITMLIFLLYQTSGWFRLKEEDYRKRYEKSNRIFRFMTPQSDYRKFKRREKIFFFSLLGVLILLLSFSIAPNFVLFLFFESLRLPFYVMHVLKVKAITLIQILFLLAGLVQLYKNSKWILFNQDRFYKLYESDLSPGEVPNQEDYTKYRNKQKIVFFFTLSIIILFISWELS